MFSSELVFIFQVFRIYLVPSPLGPPPFEESLIGMLSFHFEAVFRATFFITLYAS